MLVRKFDEDLRVVRAARDRERKTRTDANRGINKYVADLGKDLERDRDGLGTDRSSNVSDKAKEHRITSDIDGVRE